MDVGEAKWSDSADVYVGYYFGRVSRLFRFPKAQREAHVIDLVMRLPRVITGSRKRHTDEYINARISIDKV